MNQGESREPQEDSVSLYELLQVLSQQRRRIFLVVTVVTLGTALLAATYYVFGQPARRLTTLEFRPTFEGAAEGLYPNGVPFGPADVLGISVVQEVFETHDLRDYCSFEDFHAGLSVERVALERQLLDARYLALLSGQGVTPVDRQRVEEEYRARLAALPPAFRIVFIQADACRSMPSDVIGPVLTTLLETWAQQAETRLGALRYDIVVPGPGSFDPPQGNQPLLIRLDLARAAIRRVLAAVDQIEQLPSAGSLRRPGTTGLNLAEIRARLTDLQVRILGPLFRQQLRADLPASATALIEEAAAEARYEQDAAQQRLDSYRSALREFSGVPQGQSPDSAPAGRAGAVLRGPADGQTLIPQLDTSFINRIVELSNQTSEFREELTRKIITAADQAVVARAEESYYADLLALARSNAVPTQPAPDAEESLAAVIAEGKRLTTELNAFYEELSRVGLHPGAAMYTTTSGSSTTVSRAFSLADLALVVAMAFSTSLLVISISVLVTSQMAAPLSRRQIT